ncbi:MAG TPA: thioesterase family protein [Anaeromyxobacteraceae bacterium]|nr:thioesterase family protein [Anaeromyxobacteraceae bacterium]
MPLSYLYLRRVRYREADPMGVAYHTHYLDYFEEARTEALRAIGLPYKAVEDGGVIMPVVEASVRYHASAYYDDLLEIETSFEAMPRARVPIGYTVRRAGEAPGGPVLATGRVVLCFVDRARGRPVPAPPAVRAAFEQAFAEAGA